MLLSVAGGLAGATAAGVVLTGAPALDILTSMNGAPGVVGGMVAGSFAGIAFAGADIASSGNVKMADGFAMLAGPLLGGIAVPMLAGGKLDMVLIGMVGGALAGSWAAQKVAGSGTPMPGKQ